MFSHVFLNWFQKVKTTSELSNSIKWFSHRIVWRFELWKWIRIYRCIHELWKLIKLATNALNIVSPWPKVKKSSKKSNWLLVQSSMKYYTTIIAYKFSATFNCLLTSYENYMTFSCVNILVPCVHCKSSIDIIIDLTWKLSWINTFKTVTLVVAPKFRMIDTMAF